MSKSNKAPVSSEVVIAVKTAILSHFATIISELSSNEKTKHCALQFTREQKHYNNDAFVAAFCEALQLSDASLFDSMLRVEQTQKRIAIYAMQKVTKLLRAVCASSDTARQYLDKYTNAIIANARANENSILNYAARASICADLRVADDSVYSVRLHCADSTASTQRSSSSIALHALKLAVYDRDSKTLTFSKKASNARVARKLLDSFKSAAEVADAIEGEVA